MSARSSGDRRADSPSRDRAAWRPAAKRMVAAAPRTPTPKTSAGFAAMAGVTGKDRFKAFLLHHLHAFFSRLFNNYIYRLFSIFLQINNVTIFICYFNVFFYHVILVFLFLYILKKTDNTL